MLKRAANVIELNIKKRSLLKNFPIAPLSTTVDNEVVGAIHGFLY